MKFVGQLLGNHFQRYPRMQLADVYKLLHQAAMGPGHAVQDRAAARARLESEAATLGDGPEEPAADPISPDGKLARIHLRAYFGSGQDIASKQGFEALLDAFVQTAQAHPPAPDKLAKFCGCLGDLAAAGGIPFSREEVERYFQGIASQGYPVVHHSDAFREAYRPAYRVVAIEYLKSVKSEG
jgi:hypothetical protein